MNQNELILLTESEILEICTGELLKPPKRGVGIVDYNKAKKECLQAIKDPEIQQLLRDMNILR